MVVVAPAVKLSVEVCGTVLLVASNEMGGLKNGELVPGGSPETANDTLPTKPLIGVTDN